MRTKYKISLPGIWDKFFHSYVHARKMLCPPYISARASASFLFPLVLQMNPPGRNICPKSTRGPDEQQRSAKAAFVCPLMQDIFQWTCTAQNPPSSHVLYQLCRNETSHNQSSTLQVTRSRICVRPFSIYKRKCYDYSLSITPSYNVLNWIGAGYLVLVQKQIDNFAQVEYTIFPKKFSNIDTSKEQHLQTFKRNILTSTVKHRPAS